MFMVEGLRFMGQAPNPNSNLQAAIRKKTLVLQSALEHCKSLTRAHMSYSLNSLKGVI